MCRHHTDTAHNGHHLLATSSEKLNTKDQRAAEQEYASHPEEKDPKRKSSRE